MLALQAALAACTSPRRAYMPAIPTGARIIGRPMVWPSTSVSSETLETSTSTRWRILIRLKSSLLARSVDSEKEPPST